MAKRKQISKKTRFEIFKRDNFTCAYCGSKPPAVVLEIDHIEPVAKGGGNEEANLITSCFECNRGKRDIPLDQVPSSLSNTIEVLKEKEDQLKAYRTFKKSVRRRENKDIAAVEKIFSDTYIDRELTEKFRRSSMRKFLSLIPKDEVEDAMFLATNKITDNPHECIRYFCGICWNKIKSEDPARTVSNNWKRLSDEYGRGVGYFNKSDLARMVESVPIAEIYDYMKKTLSKRRSSYWKHLVNSLKSDGLM